MIEKFKVKIDRDKIKHGLGKTARMAGALSLSVLSASFLMNTIGKTDEQIGPIPVSLGFNYNPLLHPIDDLKGGVHVGLEDAYAGYPTHTVGPELLMTPTDVDFQGLQDQLSLGIGGPGESVSTSPKDTALADIDRIQDEKYLILGRSLGAAALGAALPAGVIMLYTRSKKHGGHGYRDALIGTGAASALLFGPTAAGLFQMATSENAMAQPTYHGGLAELHQQLQDIPDFPEIANKGLNNLAGVYSLASLIDEKAQRDANIPVITKRIMTGSDPHSTDDSGYVLQENERNPLDAYIVSGDYVNFGFTYEDGLLYAKEVTEAGIPEYGVAGNHDPRRVMEILDKIPGMHVANKGELVAWNISGLRALAIGDPNYYTGGPLPDEMQTPEEHDALREQIVIEVNRAKNIGTGYDIIVTHEYELIDGLDVDVQGIIVGHTHKFNFENPEGKPWVLTNGSITGAGLRSDSDADGEPTPQQYGILSLDGACQLVQLESISNDPLSPTEESTYSRVLNRNYDPELAKASDRCA